MKCGLPWQAEHVVGAEGAENILRVVKKIIRIVEQRNVPIEIVFQTIKIADQFVRLILAVIFHIQHRPACSDESLRTQQDIQLHPLDVDFDEMTRAKSQVVKEEHRNSIPILMAAKRSGPTRLNSILRFLSGISADSYAASSTVGSITV